MELETFSFRAFELGWIIPINVRVIGPEGWLWLKYYAQQNGFTPNLKNAEHFVLLFDAFVGSSCVLKLPPSPSPEWRRNKTWRNRHIGLAGSAKSNELCPSEAQVYTDVTSKTSRNFILLRPPDVRRRRHILYVKIFWFLVKAFCVRRWCKRIRWPRLTNQLDMQK